MCRRVDIHRNIICKSSGVYAHLQAQNKLGKISAAKLKRINFEGDGGSVSKPIKGKSKGAAVGMKSGKTSKRK